MWGVACWPSNTQHLPRRVGLAGSPDSQRSHALDTSVRRLGQGPLLAPLHTGLPLVSGMDRPLPGTAHRP